MHKLCVTTRNIRNANGCRNHRKMNKSVQKMNSGACFQLVNVNLRLVSEFVHCRLGDVEKRNLHHPDAK